ncbi:coiled-coil domain-containing protein 66 isoform X4 [Lepus europaeus]|uniref:coiled-coil domain-containing protein 66 isoform X4 n=1 Tax=Lepus europaeus TaxID=9983 RepID=UPI002B499005|nr:coiled-coil domain-containing protein 66 isoform X4 [Lepus europaeus]
MNLGDGLKLETELLDGKTKLILSPFEHKSKISVKMGNKTKIAKCALRAKQTGHILKSTQNTCIRSKELLQKKAIGSETLQTKGEKSRMTFSLAKDLCKPYLDKDCLHIQKEFSPATPKTQRTRNSVNTSPVAKQQACKKPITADNMKSSLVCLTQDQLQQILMSVNQGNRPISLTENGKEEETSQCGLNLSNIPNQPKDENIIGLLQKSEAVSLVPDENKSVLYKNQEASVQSEQKTDIENEWKPADIFSTLGERERYKSLLEAKKAQWKKELDEQVALKKKEKEVSEKWNNSWKKSDSDKILWEKLQDFDRSRVSASSSIIMSPSPNQVTVVEADEHSLLRASQILEEAAMREHPFSAIKQEQQRKWIEELNKQIEGDRQRKIEEKIIYSKGEEHDRWAVHFDSLKSCLGSQSQLSSRSTHKQPEYFCISPETQELADISSVCTPMTGIQVEPSEEAQIAKPVRDVTMVNTQKTNFLRSMTALLDPAQIEERERRRQKQLEHQEIMTLKTNELFQTMQRAQELAQRLKQEQRIRELAQKGHDTSRLIKNLGVDTIQLEYNVSTSNLSNVRHEFEEVSGTVNTCISPTTSPRKDTGVQTDQSVIQREISSCPSPEISIGFNGQFKKNKQGLSQDKGANLEKENSWQNDESDQFTRTEKPTKHMKKYPKRPDWNINKPLRRYIPASEKYPKQLQKQREEKKLRRQMELLHLVERNNPGQLSENRGSSPALHPFHQEAESKTKWHLGKKEAEPSNINSFSQERSQSPPVPAVKNKTQQTQTSTLHLPVKNNSYEKENVISGSSPTELSPSISEPSHFVPYVRTNEIYYLDPDAPLSRPSTQNSHGSDQQQQLLFDDDHVTDPLLNPNLVKNRDRQQAILKGLSELRQGLLQKQKELETNLMPLAANQEENFSCSF